MCHSGTRRLGEGECEGERIVCELPYFIILTTVLNLLAVLEVVSV